MPAASTVWIQFIKNMMSMQFVRNKVILKRDLSCLIIIDVQEKILPVMVNPDLVLNNILKLIKGFKILQIPIFFTEQYPKGLGATAAPLLSELQDMQNIQKMSFSCFGAENLFEQLKAKKIEQVIVCGIESHVCVQQTVLDLLANAFQVNVPADAISSRKEMDYNIAVSRMQKHGAEITTTESVLFELLEVCGTDEFKQISKIVK